VKYKREGEWYPWPIDLIDDQGLMQEEKRGFMGESVSKYIHPSQPQLSLTTKKQTLFASGENLTVIRVPELEDGEGNVHTGGTPPWLLPDSDNKTKTSNLPHFEAPVGPSLPTKAELKKLVENAKSKKKVLQRKNPRKLGGIFNRANIVAGDDNWLPKFW